MASGLILSSPIAGLGAVLSPRSGISARKPWDKSKIGRQGVATALRGQFPMAWAAARGCQERSRDSG